MSTNLERIANQSLYTGYIHHSYDLERQLKLFLSDDKAKYVSQLQLDTYADVLAPDTIRAIKNSLISFLTLYCRFAIDLGLSPEKSFSISDYFINQIELAQNKESLAKLKDDILYGYKSLLHKVQFDNYSLHISKAIRIMQRDLYKQVSVQNIADELGINERYFSTLFKQEMGLPPAQYIQKLKIDDAKVLIQEGNYKMIEIAEILGYSSTSHFSRQFKKWLNLSPSDYRKRYSN